MNERKDIVLENVAAQLRSEGYDVYISPSSTLLPDFLHGLRPDAVALGPKKNLIIEVKRPTRSRSIDIDKLRQAVAARKDWELRVYGVTPGDVPGVVKPVPREAIQKSIADVEQLLATGHPDAALLMGWATLEAVGRSLLARQFAKPQTPGRLVEVLASEGQLTPTEADHLRRLAPLRNSVIHGGLRTDVGVEDVRGLVDVLRTLSEIPRP